MFSVAHFGIGWPQVILIENQNKMIFYDIYFMFPNTVSNIERVQLVQN